MKLFTKYSRFIKDAKDGKNLRDTKIILLEGKSLIKEAVMSKCVSLNKIFFAQKFLNSKENQFFAEKNLSKFKLEKISNNLLNSWSNMETSQGIFGRIEFYKTVKI